ncbi:polysaccharide biosynthesis tyrosine autokinase [Chthonobacter rhizosphaerae]|uniref:polysaccharide biosynthesis tyrosine autokinase n=1 Tax=Chthonobacter rhizosphaerae TaxID=2735553 RepID=UPI0015EFCF10|nr:polysaccharide biosynthesis tyrosine autokinase [Chthonobacter rhizosphaerae]
MLKEVDQAAVYDIIPNTDAGGTTLDIDWILAAARRQMKVVGLAALSGLLLGTVFALTSTPVYTARTTVLIDGLKSNTLGEAEPGSNFLFESSGVDSQVLVVKSEKVANAVINELNLLEDPEFNADTSSLLDKIKGTVIGTITNLLTFGGGGGQLPDEAQNFVNRRIAVERLIGNTSVERVGNSFVIDITYTSPFPYKAAQIANAVADAYIDDQLGSKYDATRRASEWLETRIQELRQQSLTSDLAVQKFRAENNLTSSEGRLLSDQQLSEVNNQLILAQAATKQAEARYMRLKSILDKGEMEAAVAESLANPVITDLRTRYLETSKLEADITNRLGPEHLQAVNLRKEMEEYNRLMFEEFGRIAESLRSELEIARTRENSIREGLNNLVGQSSETNQMLVTLRELERESQTYNRLYQDFLARYQEALQKQSFPVSEARIITPATQPLGPSAPKKGLMVFGSLFFGLMMGVGIGALREFRDRGFRTGQQVEQLGLEFLGVLPRSGPPTPTDLSAKGKLASRLTGGGKPAKTARPLADLSTNVVHMEYARNRARSPNPVPAIMRRATLAPLSRFSETLRATKVAIDIATVDHRPKVIGIVSLLPGEGKTTVSKNLASMIAHQGGRTLLIDGDLRNPGLSRAIGATVDVGLAEVLLDQVPYEDALLIEPDTQLSVLPVSGRQRITHSSDLLASGGMRSLIKEAGQSYDYVLVDLPPIGPVVDARAAAGTFDGFIYVIEWGATSRSSVRRALQAEAAIARKCIGVVLNKVDAETINLYETTESAYHDHARYSAYYRDPH